MNAHPPQCQALEHGREDCPWSLLCLSEFALLFECGFRPLRAGKCASVAQSELAHCDELVCRSLCLLLRSRNAHFLRITHVAQRAQNGQNQGFGRQRGPPSAVAKSWGTHLAPCISAGQHSPLGLRKRATGRSQGGAGFGTSTWSTWSAAHRVKPRGRLRRVVNLASPHGCQAGEGRGGERGFGGRLGIRWMPDG